jgi:hypothetical protein
MIDAVAELADEAHIVDALVGEVTRVVVEPEALVVADGLEQALGRGDVTGDLSRVHLEGEVDVVCIERLEDLLPAFAHEIEARLNILLAGGREGIDGVPDRRAGETVDHGLAAAGWTTLHDGLARSEEVSRRLRGQFHLGAGTQVHSLRITVTPDVRREDGAVSLIDAVAGGLADKVRRDGPATEIVLGKELPE